MARHRLKEKLVSQEAAPGWPDNDMVEAAMGIISNVDLGGWTGQSEEWRRAAVAWLQAYDRYNKRESEHHYSSRGVTR